ncbi:hypothetical protein FQR65_LT13653 [Abscondita terminalis]|nr:hypothetical protein FQR65_LT13653 [Abscondita terminalis]
MLYVNGILLKVDKLNEGEVVSKIKLAVTTEINEIDLNKSCRICLNAYEKSELFCLFSTNAMFQTLSISTAIEECYGITLEQHKDLPAYVCVQCASNTLHSYTFKKCLLQSEETLRLRVLDTAVTNNNDTEVVLPDASMKHEEDLGSDFLEYKDENILMASDHNYCKDISIIDEIKDENDVVEELQAVTDSVDNTSEISEQLGEDKKYSIKCLSSNLEKWWLRSCGPPYQCKICSRDYGAHYSAFYMHVRNHLMNKPACVQCGRRFPYDKLLLHMRSHTNEKPFACKQCPARFSLQGNLKRHLVCHTGEKPYICDICGKGFTQNSSMQTHKQIHSGITQIICEYCGKPFTTKNYYKSHLNKYHNDAEQLEDLSKSDGNGSDVIYKCNTCERVFTKLQSLNQHLRVHDVKGQFTCAICNASFGISFCYKVHMFIHEILLLEDGSDMPPCKFCFYEFSNKTDFELHLLEHIEKPFQCKHCLKSYNRKIKLSYHLRQHSGLYDPVSMSNN